MVFIDIEIDTTFFFSILLGFNIENSYMTTLTLFSRLTDLYPSSTKLIVLVGSFFEMVGSAMYFFGLSAWFLVTARLVAGMSTYLVYAYSTSCSVASYIKL